MYKLADSTLMAMTKKEIIEHLRVAEHNHKVAEETINQQYENCQRLLREEYNKGKAEGYSKAENDYFKKNEEILTQQFDNGYNKAVDDFADKICTTLEEYQTGFNMVSMANVWHFSKEIAEGLRI